MSAYGSVKGNGRNMEGKRREIMNGTIGSVGEGGGE